jgi:hypothetical protein
MEEPRRIQRVWGYIELCWNIYNQPISMLIDGEKVNYANSQREYRSISIGIFKDYLVTCSEKYIYIWEYGKRIPHIYFNNLEDLFFNSEICYYSLDFQLMVVSTRVFLEWVLDILKTPRLEDLLEDATSLSVEELSTLLAKSQVLDKIKGVFYIKSIDNTGHIVMTDNEMGDDRLFNYGVIPSIEYDFHTTYTPIILCPHGKYVANVFEEEIRGFKDTQTTLFVGEYTTRVTSSDKVIRVEINEHDVPIILDMPISNSILIWIDSETLLVYNTTAFILNVVNKKKLDITLQTENTDDSEEVFILDNGESLSLETVKKWARKLRSEDVHLNIPECVVDRVYAFMK